MKLDIEQLRLTHDEELDARVLGTHYDDFDGRPVADAQLAKALWGLVDLINENHYQMFDLEDALEAAGIPRPEKLNDSTP